MTRHEAADEHAKQVAWELALENLVARLRTLGPTDPDTLAALPTLAACGVTPRGVQVLGKIYARGAIQTEDLTLLAIDGIALQTPVETARLRSALSTAMAALVGQTTVGHEQLIEALGHLNGRAYTPVDGHDLDAAAHRLLQRDQDDS